MAMTEESRASLEMQHTKKPSSLKGVTPCETPVSNGGSSPVVARHTSSYSITDEELSAAAAADKEHDVYHDEERRREEEEYDEERLERRREEDEEEDERRAEREFREDDEEEGSEEEEGELINNKEASDTYNNNSNSSNNYNDKMEGGGGSDRPTTRSDNNKSHPLTSCMKCDTEQSITWHKTSQGIVLCSSCSQDSSIGSKGYKNKLHCKRINNLHNKRGAKKNKDGKLRKSSHKLPHKEATYMTSHQIYYKGVRYKVGDVFSIRGTSRLFYVCIKSFMEDPLCNQYAVLIWLLPLYPNPVLYNPRDFLLGPAEDVPRPLDCLSFVSHDPPQGHITLNELRCYDSIPDLWDGSGVVTSSPTSELQQPDRGGLDLLLAAMEPDIHQIR